MLKLGSSNLNEEQFQSLKGMQHLLFLSVESAYKGLCLHFQNGCFQKLKELQVGYFFELRDIIIDKGALPSLKKNLPARFQHLEKLDVLQFQSIRFGFELYTYLEHVYTEEYWNWIMEHVHHIMNREKRNMHCIIHLKM